ncbi:protein hinderin isoform X2 [Trichomycterus rosablanca]
MGLKSVSVGSNQVKNRGRIVSNPEQAHGKKSSKMTDTPLVNSLLQKTSAFSAQPKTSPQVSDALQAQEISHKLQIKSKASLKDLCSEDKRRIANLIEELARVSEEKEESVQRLRDEQETFEKKIQQLEEQNELIEQERESLKQQYRECQELLGLYQQYLSHQQEKLNKSIAQASQSHSHCKSARSARTSRSAHGGRGAALDGSYLDLPPPGNRPESVVCTHSITNIPPSTPSCCGRHHVSLEHGTLHAHGCPGGERTDPAHVMQSNREQVAARSCGAPVPRCSRHSLGPTNVEDCGVEHSETLPPVGRQDWEAKRQRLLLQKKQLEAEREKLQARLAEQEERLLRQNQELRQSRLNHSRFQQAVQAELGPSFNRTALNEDPQRGASVNLPSSEEVAGGLQVLKGSVRRPVNDVQPSERNIHPPQPTLVHEVPAVTKQDMGTSPVRSQNFHPPPPLVPSSYPRTPEPPKLDSSLIELLDIFSPIGETVGGRLNLTAHRSLTGPRQPHSGVRNSLISPKAQMKPSHEELEESQILEDIFFIC